GRGRIVMRARTDIEITPSGREKIIVTEIPYMVNKAELIRKTADLINEKKIEGISYINDESDRTGMRIVIILKKDATSNIVLNNLYKYTQLQSTFAVNNIALVNGRPKVLTLKLLISYFVKHRHEIVLRRTRFEMEQAKKRAHILEGLLTALDHLDEVIQLIRSSKTPEEAKNGLMENFDLTEVQAKAILDLRLQKLTGLEREKIRDEYEELKKLIEHLSQILLDENLQMNIIKEELFEIKEKYGDDRRTELVPDEGEFNPEDFYADEDVVITISHLGYIKRTPLSEFRRQSRGGVGARGGTTRDEDFLEHLYIASMHNTMLFFTERGKCYWLKVYRIPEGTKYSKGRAIQNVINLEPEDNLKAYINVKKLDDQEYVNNNFIVLCTKRGVIKKTSLEAYSRPRQNGINAITVREGDQLLEAKMTNGNHEILLAVRSGRAIRFPEKKVRPMGRTASGVRGIVLSGEQDEVVGMICVEDESENILVVSENGFGKRSKIEDYRITNRGGKGVKTINVTEKTGSLIAIKGVIDTDDLMIITKLGLTIRMPVADMRIMGRATQGVKLINLKEDDSIASVAYVEVNNDEENGNGHENGDVIEQNDSK
ncbi:MAG: DNA gyrase subunit A, partial [Bacteroidales bacterium]|nr:DNA gyrase subunit A [Bacteroidales bacterium]